MDFLLSLVLIGLLLISSSLNFVNWIIFSSKNAEFKNNIYRLIKINSIIDAISALTLSVCLLEFNPLWYIKYHLYLSSYVSRVFNLYSSLLGIQIAINRYKVLRKANVLISNIRIKSHMKFICLQIFQLVSKSRKSCLEYHSSGFTA